MSSFQNFHQIYEDNAWGYGSGVGSLPINNVAYMEFLQFFIEKNNIKSVVDFGCGDWQFSRLLDWKGATYLGIDAVDAVIERNRKAFAREGVSFGVFTSAKDVPEADLLICKDVFQHLPSGVIMDYLASFKGKFRYLLITNDEWPDGTLNGEIEAGGWRSVRLDRAPFNEVAPVILSWMITWGGWKPTRKTTSLIFGHGIVASVASPITASVTDAQA